MKMLYCASSHGWGKKAPGHRQLHGLQPHTRRHVPLGVNMQSRVPPYFDFLIQKFDQGMVSRCVHLGHWDEPPVLAADACPAAQDIERAVERLHQVLLGMADLHHGQDVLDVGCGFGATLQHINQRFEHMRLVGVNIDPRQLGICRAIVPLHHNTLRWVGADACHLPFPDQSFDRISCIEAMFHFTSRRAFFGEVARLLRPGGTFVASDIVLTASARQVAVPRFCIEAPLRDGYGPWPDFWGEDADYPTLGSAAGLRCTRLLDATLNTRPSHRFTVPHDSDTRRDPGDPLLRAAMMLKWLHNENHLQYMYMRFDKPEGPVEHASL
jgi:MPBQ/MSBQ methyltransferase